MRFPSLQEIRELRTKLGLTQAKLARLAGVSQSLIAKIEGGRLQPSYETATRIFSVLFEVVERKSAQTVSAGTIMKQNVLFVFVHDPVVKALKLMEEHEISQLPVMAGRVPVGSISEEQVFRMLAKEEREGFRERTCGEIMEAPFPMVPPSAPLSCILPLLEHYRAVVVFDGKVRGIITKADIIRFVRRKK